MTSETITHTAYKPCILWEGATRNGYGVIRREGKTQYVHRYFYSQRPDFNPNLHVLHTCDNPLCYEETHLFQGTHKKNMKDMSEKKRVYKSPTGRAPQYDKDEILLWLSKGLSLDSVADIVGCHKSTVKYYKENYGNQ